MATSSVKLFSRSVEVTVSTIQIRDLAMAFKVEKTLLAKPNKAELQIWNLNPDHRKALEQLKKAPVSIIAGYKDAASLLFIGDLQDVRTEIDGPDRITKLQSGDGATAIQKARIAISVQKGTTSDLVLKQAASALGVGEGNLSQAVAAIRASGFASVFSSGTVAHGSAARVMTGVCRSLNLTWSIHNGKLQILPRAKALEGEAILLNRSTGMIGSPTVDNKGVMKVVSLMAPDIFPGRKLVLEAEGLKGNYRIEKTIHEGETHGPNWYVSIEAKRI